MFAKSARKQELYAAPSWAIASVAWAVSFGSAGTISRTRRDSVRWFAAVWHAVTVPRTSPAEAVWPIAPMSSWIFWSWGFRLRGPGDKLVIRGDGRRGRFRRPRRDRTVLRAAAGRSQGDDDWDHPEPSLHRLPFRSGRSLRPYTDTSPALVPALKLAHVLVARRGFGSDTWSGRGGSALAALGLWRRSKRPANGWAGSQVPRVRACDCPSHARARGLRPGSEQVGLPFGRYHSDRRPHRLTPSWWMARPLAGWARAGSLRPGSNTSLAPLVSATHQVDHRRVGEIVPDDGPEAA
jgi:hypothetical protein